jgi:hypothetical protein
MQIIPPKAGRSPSDESSSGAMRPRLALSMCGRGVDGSPAMVVPAPLASGEMEPASVMVDRRCMGRQVSRILIIRRVASTGDLRTSIPKPVAHFARLRVWLSALIGDGGVTRLSQSPHDGSSTRCSNAKHLTVDRTTTATRIG